MRYSFEKIENVRIKSSFKVRIIRAGGWTAGLGTWNLEWALGWVSGLWSLGLGRKENYLHVCHFICVLVEYQVPVPVPVHKLAKDS